jgi:hypothetical protein
MSAEVPSITTAAPNIVPEVPSVDLARKSKAEAQRRLDEDTRKVRFVRGEVYQIDDNNWGIAWGGKYPLKSQTGYSLPDTWL